MTHEQYLAFENSINARAQAKYDGQYRQPVIMPTELIGDTADHELSAGTNNIALGENGTLDNLKIKGSEMEGATTGNVDLRTLTVNTTQTANRFRWYTENTDTWVVEYEVVEGTTTINNNINIGTVGFGANPSEGFSSDGFANHLVYTGDNRIKLYNHEEWADNDGYMLLVGFEHGTGVRPSFTESIDYGNQIAYQWQTATGSGVNTVSGSRMQHFCVSDFHGYDIWGIALAYNTIPLTTVCDTFLNCLAFQVSSYAPSEKEVGTYYWKMTKPFAKIIKLSDFSDTLKARLSANNYGNIKIDGVLYTDVTKALPFYEYLYNNGMRFEYEPFTGGLPAPNSSYPLTETVSTSDDNYSLLSIRSEYPYYVNSSIGTGTFTKDGNQYTFTVESVKAIEGVTDYGKVDITFANWAAVFFNNSKETSDLMYSYRNGQKKPTGLVSTMAEWLSSDSDQYIEVLRFNKNGTGRTLTYPFSASGYGTAFPHSFTDANNNTVETTWLSAKDNYAFYIGDRMYFVKALLSKTDTYGEFTYARPQISYNKSVVGDKWYVNEPDYYVFKVPKAYKSTLLGSNPSYEWFTESRKQNVIDFLTTYYPDYNLDCFYPPRTTLATTSTSTVTIDDPDEVVDLVNGTKYNPTTGETESITPITTYSPNTTVTYGGNITATYSSDDPYSETERLVEIAVENSK